MEKEIEKWTMFPAVHKRKMFRLPGEKASVSFNGIYRRNRVLVDGDVTRPYPPLLFTEIEKNQVYEQNKDRRC